MKRDKLKKYIGIFFILIVIFSYFNISNVFAAVNENYGTSTGTYEEDLDGKFKDDLLLSQISIFIYDIASWLESSVASAFELITGEKTFPWADRIIFNCIPLLDINFINPEPGSLFLNADGTDTILARITASVYYTVLILCVSFLGIVTAVMAIKMAITTVASKKATYKESMIKFLVSVVALFGVHFALSLIFYLNEQITELASSILIGSIKDTDIVLNLDETVGATKILEEFFEANNGIFGSTTEEKEWILDEEHPERANVALNLIRNKVYKESRLYMATGNSGYGDDTKSFSSLWKNGLREVVLVTFTGPIGVLASNIYDYVDTNTDEEVAAKNLKEDVEKILSWSDADVREIEDRINDKNEVYQYLYENILKSVILASMTDARFRNTEYLSSDGFLLYISQEERENNFIDQTYGECYFLDYKDFKEIYDSMSSMSTDKMLKELKTKVDECMNLAGVKLPVFRNGNYFNYIKECYISALDANGSGSTFDYSTEKGKQLAYVANLNTLGESYLITGEEDIDDLQSEIKNIYMKMVTNITYNDNIDGTISGKELIKAINDSYSDRKSLDTVYLQSYYQYNQNSSKKSDEYAAQTLIQEMGAYFKRNAWTYDIDSNGEIEGWEPTRVTIDGAIMYAIFIMQSILFLLSYVRRLFYVVILSMLAPAIILYDFFVKALN